MDAMQRFTANLVQLYSAWGKKAEADKWRKQLSTAPPP